MKYLRILFIFLFLLINFAGYGQVNPNHVYVSGYTRSDGTVVKPYYRTAPNSTNIDNFSTKGNTNPYTGEPGYIPRDDIYAYKYISNTKLSSYSKTYRNTEHLESNGSQIRWVSQKLYKNAKRSKRKDLNYKRRLISFSKKQKRISRRNKSINISNLKDGWYNVNFTRPLEYKGELKTIQLERQVLISNNKITKYIGSEKMLFDVDDIKRKGNGYELKIIYPDNSTSKEYLQINFYQKKPLKKAPKYNYPSVVFFYVTNTNYGGEISLVVESKEKVYWGGYLEKYWNKIPDCQTMNDVIKFYLPKGKYLFYAENNQSFWKNTLEVDNNCQAMRLTF